MRPYFYLFLLLIISNKTFSQDSTNTLNKCQDEVEIYDLAEIDPMFSGGQDSMFIFFMQSIVVPPTCACGSWLIYIGFVVNQDGSLCDIKTLKGSGMPLLDAEALRVVQSMPNWIPAQNGGKVVRSRYVVPITIKII